ncbi:MAG: hypothetical protein KGI60_00545 [Patescibacteria group bacterium]|nr:hypothetical protein [Patescibacteria group bacterium]
MEQYELPPKKYRGMLAWAIRNFPLEYIYIRDKGSSGGSVHVNENMRGKKLSLKFVARGMRVIIDGKAAAVLHKYDSDLFDIRWTIAYYREYRDGRQHYAITGYPHPQEPQYSGPDDSLLPEVKRTVFRSVIGAQLIEITFTGKIPIRRTDILAFPPSEDFHCWEIDYRRHEKQNHPQR